MEVFVKVADISVVGCAIVGSPGKIRFARPQLSLDVVKQGVEVIACCPLGFMQQGGRSISCHSLTLACGLLTA